MRCQTCYEYALDDHTLMGHCTDCWDWWLWDHNPAQSARDRALLRLVKS